MKWSITRALGSALALALILIATPRASAQFINGNFEIGDLTGWTTYTTPNGTLGPPGFPNVASFDTTGSGASLAAHFNVGNAVLPNQGQQGGGIIQSLILGPGNYTVRADIASRDAGGNNAAAGLFSVLVDGATAGSTDLGPFSFANQILRGTLTANFTIASAGSHEFRFQITRNFLSSTATPEQFLDNITIPEPSSLILLGMPVLGLIVRRQRR